MVDPIASPDRKCQRGQRDASFFDSAPNTAHCLTCTRSFRRRHPRHYRSSSSSGFSTVKEDDKREKMYVCMYCDVIVPTVYSINKHVMGRKHRARMDIMYPGMVPVKNLKHYLDTCMKDKPILGLEHVVEVQMGSYLYLCHLCPVILYRAGMLSHLCGLRHVERYLQTHHPEVLASSTHNIVGKHNRIKAIHCAAGEIYSQYGRKEMKTLAIADKGPTPAKMAKYVHNENDRPKSSDQYEAEREKWKLLDQSPFTHNDEFFAYMRDFEIRNEEDASFVKMILQNCNNAQKISQPEQANATGVQESPASSHQAPAPTGQADPEHLGYSPKTVDESVPSVSQCAVSSSLEPELAKQSDAKEIFFSNIKNMDASQIHRIFQYIAATHPEFRGINVPDVIRYLQEPGSLKPA